MRISLVTPSFNQGDFIEETIVSVLSQGYEDLEYIVMDGGSTDQTLSILKRYNRHLSAWISEPDEGQAHALNKGFSMATGEICAYLNSDDLLLNGSLDAVVLFFQQHPEAKWVVSSTLVGSTPSNSSTWNPQVVSLEEFLVSQSFSQQGVFWRSDAIPRPWFDEQFDFIMDADFFVHLYRVCGRPFVLPCLTSFFRIHPNSKTSNIAATMYSEAQVLRCKCSDLFSPSSLSNFYCDSSYLLFLSNQSKIRALFLMRSRAYSMIFILLRSSVLSIWQSRRVFQSLPVLGKTFLLMFVSLGKT